MDLEKVALHFHLCIHPVKVPMHYFEIFSQFFVSIKAPKVYQQDMKHPVVNGFRGKYLSLFPWRPSRERFFISSNVGKGFEMFIGKFWIFSTFLGLNFNKNIHLMRKRVLATFWNRNSCCFWKKIWEYLLMSTDYDGH